MTRKLSIYRLVEVRCYQEALARLNNNEHTRDPPDSLLGALGLLCYIDLPGPEAIAVVAKIVQLKPELAGTSVNKSYWDGITPLHLAVLRSSSVVTLTLIRANPGAVSVERRDGMTPFHLAACQRNPDMAVIQAMMEADPGGVLKKLGQDPKPLIRNRDHDGKTPFHLACKASANLAVLKAMLRAHPTLASMLCSSGESPADLLWRKKSSMGKLALVLTTGHYGRVVGPVPMEHILHAVCSQPCRWDLVSHLFEKFLDQASQRDDRGNLPLHYAVRNSNLLFQGPLAKSSKKTRHHLRRDIVWSSDREWEAQVSQLRERGGRHSILWNEDVISKLVDAYPEALQEVDAIDGLPPFLASALMKNENHMSFSYQLLRATPDAVLGALQTREDEASTALDVVNDDSHAKQEGQVEMM